MREEEWGGGYERKEKGRERKEQKREVEETGIRRGIREKHCIIPPY